MKKLKGQKLINLEKELLDILFHENSWNKYWTVKKFILEQIKNMRKEKK